MQNGGNVQEPVPSALLDTDFSYYANWRPKLWGPVIRDTVVRLGDLRGKKVLEIGYFDGRMAVLFSRCGASYTGYDIYPGAVERAKQTASEANVTAALDFRDGDWMQLTGQFDLVFMKSVLYHLANDQEYLAWLHKVRSLLAPGGRLVVLENGEGVWLNRLVRKMMRRHYIRCLLYSEHVEGLFRQVFPSFDVRYYYVWSQFTPFPALMSKIESCIVKPDARRCFIASVVAGA